MAAGVTAFRDFSIRDMRRHRAVRNTSRADRMTGLPDCRRYFGTAVSSTINALSPGNLDVPTTTVSPISMVNEVSMMVAR